MDRPLPTALTTTLKGALAAAAAIAVAIAAAACSSAASPGSGPSGTSSRAAAQAAVRPAGGATVASIVSGRFTTKTPEPAFLRWSRDDSGHVSYRVDALKVKPPRALPIYLLGGSNVRECIETPASLQKPLKAASHVATTVINLGSSDQNFGATMAAVDNLPKGPGVVVIAVSHWRFAYEPAVVARQIQGFGLLMKSTALWRFTLNRSGHAPKNTIAPGVGAFFADWRRRNAATLAAGKRPWNVYQAHRYIASLPDAGKRAQVTRFLTGPGAPGGDFSNYHGYNAALLDATIRLAHGKSLSVVLMEVPQNDAVIAGAFDKYRKVYRPLCRSIAAADGATYIDLNAALKLTDGDFHDITHLIAAGRALWARALAAALAPVVKDAVAHSPTPSP